MPDYYELPYTVLAYYFSLALVVPAGAAVA